MTHTDKIKCIAHYYGLKSQINIAIEEMSELTKELCKHKRGYQNKIAITEEISDVYIMLDQLCILFDIKGLDLDTVTMEKLDRQLRRMEAEND